LGARLLFRVGGVKSEGPKQARDPDGRQRGGVLGLTSYGTWGAVSSPAGVWGGASAAKRFSDIRKAPGTCSGPNSEGHGPLAPLNLPMWRGGAT